MTRVVLIMFVLVCSTGSLAAKDWRGILPMHSTRADVERLLGSPITVHGQSGHSLRDAEVSIVYAQKKSPGITDCLSVAEDTVLAIRVTPSANLSLKDLNFDESRFRQFNPAQISQTEYQGFINEEEGLVIRVRKGIVQEMVYVASAMDRPRCPGFYSDLESFVRLPAIACALRFDGYGYVEFEDEKARLDNFAIQILNTGPESNGHVIVYAGRKATVAEAQLRANRIKDYLLNVREIDPKRLTVVDGGHQEEFMVELYIVPAGAAPPEPSPTVEAKDVELIYERPKRRSRRRN